MAVQRTDERVWIDSVKAFSPGEYASSVHGAQARILQAIGDPLTYDDLICYSAFAFRTGVHRQLCPSAGHPCCGYMCIENGVRAFPWRTRFFEMFPWGKETTVAEAEAIKTEARAAIADSIDRGVPVHYGSEEDGLIIGYGDEGRRWWCSHPYHKWGAEPFWFDEAKGFAGGEWPWGIVVWLEPKPPAERTPEPELTRAALQQVVDMWHHPDTPGERYLTGDAAYAFWLDWLRAVDAGTAQDPASGMQGNGWCYDVLAQSRPIAARWLRRKAEAADPAARPRLLEAADQYQQLADQLMADIDCPWSLCPGPEKAGEWTPDMRRKEISRLQTARTHDRAAIAAIAAAIQ